MELLALSNFVALATEGGISGVTNIVTSFFSEFSALAGVIAGSFLFLIPVAIKFTGKTIGFVKSLMGTGGRRRR